MTDYKKIADGDPGGDLQAAYEAMIAETEQVSRGEYRVTDKMIASALGLAAANDFLDAVEMAVPARVTSWLKSGGIDVNHVDTVSTLTAINPPNVVAVLAMGKEAVSKYPAMEITHLEKARSMRSEDRI